MRGKAQADQGRTDNTPDTPISDQELEAALMELRAHVTRDVAALLEAKRLLLPADELHEAVQYAFGEAAIRRPGHPRPRAWLRTVAYRYAVNARLKQRREIEAATALALLGAEAIHHGRPADAQLSVEVAEVLEAIAKLPDRQRETITLTAAGYSRQEISARLGIAPGSVKHYVWLARRNLRCQFRP
jgi:RNA polymerase sigma factor (sigma-70 family)